MAKTGSSLLTMTIWFSDPFAAFVCACVCVPASNCIQDIPDDEGSQIFDQGTECGRLRMQVTCLALEI